MSDLADIYRAIALGDWIAEWGYNSMSITTCTGDGGSVCVTVPYDAVTDRATDRRNRSASLAQAAVKAMMVGATLPAEG